MKVGRVRNTGLIVVLFATLWLAACDSGSSPSDSPKLPLQVTQGCDPVATTCEAQGSGVTMQLHLGPGVKPLQPFPLLLKVQGAGAEKADIHVDFGMVGMDMGINRYQLQRVAGKPGQWQGRITLPICTAGRQDWIATVTMASAKGVYVARYTFSSHK